MKKLLSLILAVAILTAMCACAEKMRELTQYEAQSLVQNEYAIQTVLAGHANVSENDTVTQNGEVFYRVIDYDADSWEAWESKLRGIYTDSAADEILNGGEVISDGLYAYARHQQRDDDGGEYVYIYTRLESVEILENSPDKASVRAVYQTKRNGEVIAVNERTVELKNTVSGWRISGVVGPELPEPEIRLKTQTVEKSFDVSGLSEYADSVDSVPLILTLDENGALVSAYYPDDVTEYVNILDIWSDSELLLTALHENLYILDINSGEFTPLLPDTAYGFTRQEYESISGENEEVRWCYTNWYYKEKGLFIYLSNKYAAGGEPVLRNGVWIYDFSDGTEYRIELSDGESADGSGFGYLDDVIEFGAYYGDDGDSFDVIYEYDLNTRELRVSPKSPAE